MAKKNFQSAPKTKNAVSLEAIEAFESGGAGHDTPNKKVTPVNKSQEPTKRLSIDLPQTLPAMAGSVCRLYFAWSRMRKNIDIIYKF
jgi:hypothetical protein